VAAGDNSLDRLLKARAEIDEELRRHKTTVTVVFTDVVGSTSYFDRYGDTAGLVLLCRHADLASEIFASKSGRVVKTIGDSVMAEFSDPLSAVRAAIELQRRLFQLNESIPAREAIHLRVGINHGPGFRLGEDVFGDAVNLAARITKRTGPGQVLVSRSVHDAVALASDIHSTWQGRVTIEGKLEKEDVFEIVWTDTGTHEAMREKVTEAIARGELMSADKTLRDSSSLLGGQSPAEGESCPATPAPLQALAGRYEVFERVGTGGMGIVYKARDKETGERVALKLLKPDITADQSAMERFKNELRLARKITHRNVCRIHEFNRVSGSAYISMEFVEGESLRHVLNRFGNLPPRKGIAIGRQICAGLGEAHAQGIIHRDLKPENVMLDLDGNVKLMDFGIAHTVHVTGTLTDVIVGTPAYMSPEQAEGKQVSAASDIYSLGLVLFELFTGSPAFTGDTPVAVALKHIREVPPRPIVLEPNVPPGIEAIILKCLEKDPARRYASAEQLEEALRHASFELGVPQGVTRKRLTTVGVLLASILGAFLLGRTVSRPATGSADASADQVRRVTPDSSAPQEHAEQPDGNSASVAPVQTAPVPVSADSRTGAKDMPSTARFSFDLKKDGHSQQVGPITILLNRADPKKRTYTLTVSMKDFRVELRDRGLLEPLRLYQPGTQNLIQILVRTVDKDRVTGIVTAPDTSRGAKRPGGLPAK